MDVYDPATGSRDVMSKHAGRKFTAESFPDQCLRRFFSAQPSYKVGSTPMSGYSVSFLSWV